MAWNKTLWNFIGKILRIQKVGVKKEIGLEFWWWYQILSPLPKKKKKVIKEILNWLAYYK